MRTHACTHMLASACMQFALCVGICSTKLHIPVIAFPSSSCEHRITKQRSICEEGLYQHDSVAPPKKSFIKRAITCYIKFTKMLTMVSSVFFGLWREFDLTESLLIDQKVSGGWQQNQRSHKPTQKWRQTWMTWHLKEKLICIIWWWWCAWCSFRNIRWHKLLTSLKQLDGYVLWMKHKQGYTVRLTVI